MLPPGSARNEKNSTFIFQYAFYPAGARKNQKGLILGDHRANSSMPTFFLRRPQSREFVPGSVKKFCSGFSKFEAPQPLFQQELCRESRDRAVGYRTQCFEMALSCVIYLKWYELLDPKLMGLLGKTDTHLGGFYLV